MKWILIGFEDLSVPKINFNKSKIIPLNISKWEVINLANRLGYKIANLPISYLGVPLHWKKLPPTDLTALIEKKIERRLQGWINFFFLMSVSRQLTNITKFGNIG